MNCLPVLEYYNLDGSPSTSYEEDPEELMETDLRVDNLYDNTDYIVFFNTLFNMSEDPQKHKILRHVLKMLEKSDISRFQQQLEFFVLKLLHEYKRKQLDYHVLLSALSLYETLPDRTIFSNTDIGNLYIMVVLRIFESRHEIFPCRCVQNILVKLYRQDNRSMFCKLIDELVKGKMHFSKYSHLIDSSILTRSNCFNLYTELLRELVQCEVIDKSGEELWNGRIVQLTVLLNEFIPDRDFPTACKSFSNFLKSMITGDQKPVGTNMKKRVRQLINKVFVFIGTCDSYGEYILNDENVENIASEILNNDTITIKSMEPLELLINLQKLFKLDSSIFHSIISQELKLTAEKLNIHLFYLITLSINSEDTILAQILSFFKENFEAASEAQKDTFLMYIKLLEIIGKKKGSVFEKCERQRFRQKLLLEPFTSTSPIRKTYIVKNLEIFNNQEFDTFCQYHLKDAKSLTDPNWKELMTKVSDMERPLIKEVEVIWKYALERGDENNCVLFIKRQLTLLAESAEQNRFAKRFNDVVRVLKEETPEFPPARLIVGFLETVLALETDKAPKNWLTLITPLAFVAYCLYYDDHEEKIRSIFQILFERITKNEQFVENDEPMSIIAKLCERSEDVKSWTKLDKKYPKVFAAVIDNSTTMWLKAKKRVAEVIAIMFSKAANDIQSDGDKSIDHAFCKLSNIFEKHMKTNFDSTNCRKMIEGFTKCDMNANKNILFLKSRIFCILLEAKKSDLEVLKEYGTILAGNTDLIDKLKMSKKNYAEIEKFVNW